MYQCDHCHNEAAILRFVHRSETGSPRDKVKYIGANCIPLIIKPGDTEVVVGVSNKPLCTCRHGWVNNMYTATISPDCPMHKDMIKI